MECLNDPLTFGAKQLEKNGFDPYCYCSDKSLNYGMVSFDTNGFIQQEKLNLTPEAVEHLRKQKVKMDLIEDKKTQGGNN